MVGSTARGMDKASRDARQKQVVVDFQFHNVVQLLFAFLKHLIQLFCLRNSSRESLKDKATRGGELISKFVYPRKEEDMRRIFRNMKSDCG